MRDHLGCIGGIESFASSLVSDCVRNTLSLEGADGANANALAYRMRTVLEAVLPGYIIGEKEMRRRRTGDSYTNAILRAMYCIGDIHKYENRYLPLSHRFINVSKGFPIVPIVGTTPSSMLEDDIEAKLVTSGVMRIVRRDELPTRMLAHTRWQALYDWLGVEEHDLKGWALSLLAAPPLPWENGEPLESDKAEIYLPDIFARRWASIAGLRSAPAGVRLCRWYSPYTRTRHHCLAVMKMTASSVAITRHSMLPAKRTGIRLMYGLDAVLGIPYEFNAIVAGDEFEIQNPREMPDPENKLLLHLGTRKLKKQWTIAFPLCMLEFVDRALRLSVGARLRLSTEGTQHG